MESASTALVRRLLPAATALAFLGLAPVTRADDPRGDLVLTWTAPADAAGGSLLEYDLRVSERAPGSDPSAWFTDGVPFAVAGPALPGSREHARLAVAARGPVYAAVRVRGAAGWSAVSRVAEFDPHPDPFLVEVEPRVVTAGRRTFHVLGAGLDPDTRVALVGEHAAAAAALVTAEEGGLRVEVEVPPALGSYALEVETEAGTDRLAGWIEVRDQPYTAPVLPYPVSDLEAVTGSDGVELTWTAPADRAGGRVVSYELRRDELPASSFVWQRAETLLPPTTPGVPGASESWLVDAVPQGEVASFAVISRDGSGRVSAVSNVVEVDRRDPPIPGAGYLAVRSRDGHHTFTVELAGAVAAREPVFRVHDVLGRVVAAPPAAVAGGVWMAEWSGQDRYGRPAAPGVYFVRVVHGAGTESAKLLVIR